MNYIEAINRVYEHLENDSVDKAVMACLRISRNLKDHFYTAVFLREMVPNNKEFMNIIYEDIQHLKKEAQKFIYNQSREYWLETHSVGYSLGKDERGDDLNIVMAGLTISPKSVPL